MYTKRLKTYLISTAEGIIKKVTIMIASAFALLMWFIYKDVKIGVLFGIAALIVVGIIVGAGLVTIEAAPENRITNGILSLVTLMIKTLAGSFALFFSMGLMGYILGIIVFSVEMFVFVIAMVPVMIFVFFTYTINLVYLSVMTLLEMIGKSFTETMELQFDKLVSFTSLAISGSISLWFVVQFATEVLKSL